MSIENPFSQPPQENQLEKSSPILELKKKFEEQTGEKCPYTDEELSRFEKEGFTLGVTTKEQQAEMDEAEQRRKELFADFWEKEGVSSKDIKWKLTDGPKVEVGRFTKEGIEVTGQVSVPVPERKEKESEAEKKLRIEQDREELERRLTVIAESARRLIDAGWGVEKTIEEAVREEADLEDEE